MPNIFDRCKIRWHRWPIKFLDSMICFSVDVWDRYLLAVLRLSNRDQIVSELSTLGHAYKYHTLILLETDDATKILTWKTTRDFRSLCSYAWWFVPSSFFPVMFHSNPFTVFRRMVVSFEKITCFQFVALLSWAHFKRFFSMHFGNQCLW